MHALHKYKRSHLTGEWEGLLTQPVAVPAVLAILTPPQLS